MFCTIAEVGTFFVAFAGKAAGRCANHIAILIVQHIILIAAMSGDEKCLFALVYVFVYLFRRIGRDIFTGFIDDLAQAGRNGIFILLRLSFLFVAAIAGR